MRGFTVPKYVAAPSEFLKGALDIKDNNLFLERVLLNAAGVRPKIHVLIPTIFSLKLDVVRDVMLLKVLADIQDKTALKILKRQDCLLKSCCKCQKQLRANDNKGYQVVFRIMGGEDAIDKQWKYDFIFALFCRKCQRRSTPALMPIEETLYNDISAALSLYGFSEPLVLDVTVLESYRLRFELLNKQTENFIRHIQMNDDFEVACFHCKRRDKLESRSFTVCAYCKAVAFCTKHVADQGRANSTCAEYAFFYHHALCEYIFKKETFMIKEMIVVD
jgi:hypothetical protein